MSKVKISEPAQFDLEEIWQYVAEDNQDAADNLLDEFGKKFQLLAGKPAIGRERQELMANLRAFPHKRYIVFYVRSGEGIEIFRVLHCSRDITQIFDEIDPTDSVN